MHLRRSLIGVYDPASVLSLGFQNKNSIPGPFKQRPITHLAFAQSLLHPLAFGEVTKNAMEKRSARQFDGLYGYQYIPEFAVLCAMLCFKVIPSFAQHLNDMIFRFLEFF